MIVIDRLVTSKKAASRVMVRIPATIQIPDRGSTVTVRRSVVEVSSRASTVSCGPVPDAPLRPSMPTS